MQLPHRVRIDSRGMRGWRHGLRDDLPAWCSAHGAVWPPRRAVQLSKQAPCWLRYVTTNRLHGPMCCLHAKLYRWFERPGRVACTISRAQMRLRTVLPEAHASAIDRHGQA